MSTPTQSRPDAARCTAPGLGRTLAAAERAELVFPGPVGEALAEHLRAWVAFGYRFGAGALEGRLVEKIEQTKESTP